MSQPFRVFVTCDIGDALQLLRDTFAVQQLRAGVPPETLREKNPNKLVPPLHGALLKNEQDIQLFERLAFLARRENG